MAELIVQIIAALAVVFSGVVIEKIAWFDTFIYFGDWAIPITVLWIVVITNTINLIDGLDGLACGISAISSLALLIVSILSIHNQTIILMAALLAGRASAFCHTTGIPPKCLWEMWYPFFSGLSCRSFRYRASLR